MYKYQNASEMSTFRVIEFTCSYFKEVMTAYISAFVVFFSISRNFCILK